MKLYSQIGHGDAGKTLAGLGAGLLDGAILSPRNCSPDDITDKIREMRDTCRDADILFDPQFYATFAASTDGSRIGKLQEWPYFRALRKSDLETPAEVERVLRDVIDRARVLPVTGIIAPNIYVSRSFDSREGVIAKSFIRAARSVATAVGVEQRLLVTLAISREALLERSEFEEFLNDITRMDLPPDGFYVVVGGRGSEARSDIFHADVIARWLLLTYCLRINGFEVINGYSDIMAPFLGAVGASGGASGWHSNLRVFSLDMFAPPPSGGRPAIKRYLSTRLLNRLTFMERYALLALVPSTTNQLPHDAGYDPEPDRQEEMLQSWEALRDLAGRLAIADTDAALAACSAAITRAEATYAEIAAAGVVLDKKSADEHLEPLREGIEKFKEMADLA